MTNYIDEVFGPSGFLAQKFAGYEPRKAQVEIVRAIDEALTNEKNLLVEAPCGSGKSVSYLVPSIRHALESGASRILVVTANNALSEQLIAKDLPTLRNVLPWQFEFAMAKGRSNYACRSAYDRIDRTLLRVLPTSREQIATIDEWAPQTTTGDLSELPFEPLPSIKQRLTVQSDECMGRKCDRFDSCFVESAKKRLEIAKVVVTNYHLYFADRMIRRLTDDESGVVVICDSRIVDKPYGRAFLKACSGARVSRNLHDVGSFLDDPEKWKRDKPEAKKIKKAEPKETIRVPRGARVR